MCMAEAVENEWFEKDYFLEHLYIGLQRNSNFNIVKRSTEFDGIEKYLYLRIEKDNEYFTAITFPEKILQNVGDGLTLEETWDMAEFNTFCESTVLPINEVLSEFGLHVDDEPTETAMFILTNHSKVRGASAVLNKELVKTFFEAFPDKTIIFIPSSIHEWIVFVGDENVLRKEDINRIVREVNAEYVSYNEQLSDRAYVYNPIEEVFIDEREVG